MSTESASKRKASTKDGRPTKKAKSTDKVTDQPANAKLQAASDAKKTRKRAADFIEEEAAPAVKPAEDSPKPKKVKISKKVVVVEPTPPAASKTKSKGDKKPSKKNKGDESKALVVAEQEEEIALPASDDDEDVAALLAGFSSDEEDEGDAEQEEGVALDQIPQAKLDKKAKKALEKANKDGDEDTPGTVYVGRIPHGFYEPQMRAYFAQFGTVLNLRLARNRKTGASKHYAFVQFTSTEVADIVARTMNNYLMFGHLLKVRLMPAEQVHAELWRGANKRFKAVPRAMLERKEMERPKGRQFWEGKVQKEKSKREKKRKAMEELGYEYSVPELKSVADVPMKEVVEAIEAPPAEADAAAEQEEASDAPKAITETPAEVDEVQVEVEKVIKKGKTAKKEKVKVKASKKAKA